MKAVLLKCPAYGRFHFGLSGLDENSSLHQSGEIVHSDTLFSALVVLCAKTFPEQVEAFIRAFKNDQIQISSAYYCLETKRGGVREKLIHFFPKPVYFEAVNEDTQERKRIKKIAYLSKAVWERGIAPIDRTEDYYDWNNLCRSVDKRFLILEEELEYNIREAIKVISVVETAPKIADHARRSANNIFFQTDLLLGYKEFSRADLKDMGLASSQTYSVQPHFYFLLDTPELDEKLKRMLYMLIELLADEGIGGAISTGCGQLKGVEIEDFEFKFKALTDEDEAETADARYKVSMSLIAPLESDKAHLKNGKIIVRGGRPIARHQQKENDRLDRLKMIKEGALVKEDVQGHIPKIHKSEKFLRYGKAFKLAVHPNFIFDDKI